MTTSSNYSSRFFKSDQRGKLDKENYKCYSTFNFDDYSDESRVPFGALQFVNDIAIAPGTGVYFNRDESIQDLILPLTGALTYKNFTGKKEVVTPENVLFPDPGTDHTCEISNTYETEWINYLHIGIKKSISPLQQQAFIHPINFTVTNTLSTLALDNAIGHSFAHVAVFTGRTKGAYTVKKSGNGIFTYIINGAFEVENRLMESRDGLGLWNINTLRFEALSENAILLIFEVPLHHD